MTQPQEWIYRDKDNTPFQKVVRFDTQFHWSNNQWQEGKPPGPKIPYRLPELIAAQLHTSVFITEGEKCADILVNLGYVATSASEGAGKWTPELNVWFKDRIVYILPDNDERSGRHAARVAENLHDVAREVRIVELPGRRDDEDVEEWLERLKLPKENVLLWAQMAPIWRTQDAEPIFDPWETYIVPDFPLEILPAVVRCYVEQQSRVIGCDASALAMACLAGFSGALDHSFKIKMMRNGDWHESVRLWLLLVGDVSVKKTPIINAATKALLRIEVKQTKEWEQELAEYQEQLDEWNKKNPKPEKPVPPPRYVTSDCTVEKLGEILAQSPRGILVKRDELAGWLGSMEKYGGGKAANSDRAFWLEVYNGGPHVIDRIKRGTQAVENLSASILGGIQPDKLAEIHGLTNDGLLQRFIPVMTRGSRFPVDAPVDTSGYDGLVERLIKMKEGTVILAEDARPVMQELQRHLHDLQQVGDGFAQGFSGFVGKLAGYAGSLALILHLISAPEGTLLVSRQTVENVKKLILDFILPHAYEFYRTADTVTDGDRIQRIASWIVTSGVKVVTTRDLTRNVTGMRGLGSRDIHARVSPLVAGGWLVPDQPGSENTKWRVTPAVARQFEERKRQEERRKTELARLMNSSRKSGCR